MGPKNCTVTSHQGALVLCGFNFPPLDLSLVIVNDTNSHRQNVLGSVGYEFV